MTDPLMTTPEKVERIPRDESFKTCKAELNSSKTKRKLRMTPARNSVLSGGTPYKEGTTPQRRFNSRRRANSSKREKAKEDANDTAGSNETFIRCEQQLLFDRDSLEVTTASQETQFRRREPTTGNQYIKPVAADKSSKPVAASQLKKSVATNQFSKPLIGNQFIKPATINKFSRPSTLNQSRRLANASLMSTTSRYLSQLNSSRITRAQSFKSTAELEKEYFSSLRSF